MSMRVLFPLVLVAGGIALVISEAKASAKKKRIDKGLDLGLDEPDESQPPLPPAMTRAYSQNPINHETFNAWWYQTPWVENGVMGFWVELDIPQDGTDWLLPGINYPDAVIVTIDGAFWYFDNGWHPAERLAQDYDAWFNAAQ